MRFRGWTAVSIVAFLGMGLVGLPSGQAAKKTQQPPAAGETVTQGHDGVLDYPKPWPAPAARPAGSLEQVAATLAKKVMAGGADALPAIQRAALESGFSIHNSEGKVVYEPEASIANGISMLDLDLVVAVEGVRRKCVSSSKDLKDQLGQEMGEGFDLVRHLRQAPAESIAHKNEGRRFWATFIVEAAMSSDSSQATEDFADTMSFPESYFLLYGLAGHAWVGLEGAPQQPDEPKDGNDMPEAEEPPQEVPEAEEPPPNGPRVAVQAGARNSAFVNLRQSITSFSDTSIVQYMQQQARRGHSGHASLLRLARQQAISTGTALRVRITGRPLVKRKVTGQEGESDDLRVSATFNVSNDFRARYEAARAYITNSQPLPLNGPLALKVVFFPNDKFVVRPREVTTPTQAPGTATITTATSAPPPPEVDAEIVGTRQSRVLPAVPLEEDVVVPLEVKAYSLAFASPILATHKKYSVDVRDWLPTGLRIEIDVKVNGSGRLSFKDQHIRWWVHRSYGHRSPIDMIMPGTAMVSMKPFDVHKPDRYTSFMSDTSKKSHIPYRYIVRELYLFDGPPAGECGVNPDKDARTTSWSKVSGYGVKSSDSMRQDLIEVDSESQVHAFATGFEPVQVTYEGSGSEPRDGPMLILTGLDLPPADKDMNVFSSGIRVLNTTSDSGFLTVVDLGGYEGWTGKRALDLFVDWKLVRPIPRSSLTDAEKIVVAREIDKAVRTTLRSIREDMDTYPAEAEKRIGQAAPLWVSDPSAATCAEIVMADALPAGITARS